MMGDDVNTKDNPEQFRVVNLKNDPDDSERNELLRYLETLDFWLTESINYIGSADLKSTKGRLGKDISLKEIQDFLERLDSVFVETNNIKIANKEKAQKAYWGIRKIVRDISCSASADTAENIAKTELNADFDASSTTPVDVVDDADDNAIAILPHQSVIQPHALLQPNIPIPNEKLIQTIYTKAIEIFADSDKLNQILSSDTSVTTKNLLKLAAKSFFGLPTNKNEKVNKKLYPFKLIFYSLPKNTTKLVLEYVPTILGESAHFAAKGLQHYLDGFAKQRMLQSALALFITPLIYLLNGCYFASKVFVWLARTIISPVANVKSAWNNWSTAEDSSWLQNNAPWVGKAVAVASVLSTITFYTLLGALAFPFVVAYAASSSVPVLSKVLHPIAAGISQGLAFLKDKPIVKQVKIFVNRLVNVVAKKLHVPQKQESDTLGAVVMVATTTVATSWVAAEKLKKPSVKKDKKGIEQEQKPLLSKSKLTLMPDPALIRASDDAPSSSCSLADTSSSTRSLGM